MLKKTTRRFPTWRFGLISVAYGNVPAPGLRKGKTRSQEFLRIVFWTNAEEILQPRRHNGHRSTVSASDFGTYIRVPENECRKIDCMINTQHDVATEAYQYAKSACTRNTFVSTMRAYRQARRNSVQAQSSTSQKNRSAGDILREIAIWLNN